MIASIIGFTALLFSLFYFHEELNQEYLEVHLDTHSRNLAIVLRNSVVAEGLVDVLKQNNDRLSDALRGKLKEVLEQELKWIPVVKAKIYSRNAVVIFSTRESEIGDDAGHNQAVKNGLNGSSTSSIVQRDRMNEFDKTIETRPLHQQYIPIPDQEGEDILAVFEIYTDISGITEKVDAAQHRFFGLIGMILVVFYFGFAVFYLSTHRKLKQETRQRLQYLDELKGLHKELEHKVAERTAGLERSEARLKTIMDNIPEAILTCNSDFRVLSTNKAAQRLFQSKDSELIGMDLNSFYSGDTGYSPENSDNNSHTMVILKRGDGTVFPADLWVGPVELSKDVVSYIVVILDMTDQLRAQEEVETTRQQYFHQEKMAAIGQLAAGILHEVGNPIAAIAGATAELKAITEENGDFLANNLDESVSQNVRLIDEQTSRLAKITREIADFASPKPRQRELLDLNGLLSSTARILSYDKRFRNTEMDIQLDRNLPAIVAVSDQLTQVFMNLLINAIDASLHKAGNKPYILIQSQMSGEQVHVIIKDRGEGVSKDLLDHLTEPFFTTKPEGKGTGLGLSLCSTIIKAHGGELRIESEIGTGTTVHVYLPIDLF
jgi:PAS domain S-box-containing protein